jgi:NADH:ubiquinone oxidoreductase subunit 4 (subunit M)
LGGFFFSLFVFLDEISCVFFTFLVTKGACGGAHEGEDNFGGVVVKARNWGVCSSFVSSAGKVLFFFFFLSFLGIVLCRAFCFFQRDIKALAAYSSVNHMSFLLLALLLLSGGRNNGALLIMVSHGFVSVLIFFLIGEFYHLRFSRNIFFLGGVFCGNVVLLFVFLFTWLFNRGVPLSLRFFGEFFCIRACFFFCFFFFFFLFLYFFNSFYYSLFFLVSGFLNKLFFSFFF